MILLLNGFIFFLLLWLQYHSSSRGVFHCFTTVILFHSIHNGPQAFLYQYIDTAIKSHAQNMTQRRITARMCIGASEGASGYAALRRAAPPHGPSAPLASGPRHIRAIRYTQLRRNFMWFVILCYTYLR